MRGIKLGMLVTAATLCLYNAACSKKAEEAAPVDIQTQEEPAQPAAAAPVEETAPAPEAEQPAAETENSEG